MLKAFAFPTEWSTAQPIDKTGYAIERGGVVVRLFGLLLADETNLFALVYPGGQRFARCCEATNWAIEERYNGDPPPDEYKPVVDEVWRYWLATMAEVNREYDRVTGRRP